MLTKFFYIWRLLATGWSFAFFSLGGLILVLLVFPVLNLLGLLQRDPRARHHRAQAAIHYTFRFFLWQMRMLGIMRMNIQGREYLHKGQPMLILANHPTLIDVVLLISIVKYTNCVVKRSLFRDPFLGGVVKAAGYINNDGTEAIVEDCVANLKNGENLIIFPEGTRSIPGEEMRFQRGAAHIAARSGVPVVPVTITCDPPTLTKAHKWYHIPDRPFELRAEVGPPLDIEAIIRTDEPATVTSRKLTRFLKDYFTQRLKEFGITRAGA